MQTKIVSAATEQSRVSRIEKVRLKNASYHRRTKSA